jgi:hypothetical protein
VVGPIKAVEEEEEAAEEDGDRKLAINLIRDVS